jgi:hypothetical protein
MPCQQSLPQGTPGKIIDIPNTRQSPTLSKVDIILRNFLFVKFSTLESSVAAPRETESAATTSSEKREGIGGQKKLRVRFRWTRYWKILGTTLITCSHRAG